MLNFDLLSEACAAGGAARSHPAVPRHRRRAVAAAGAGPRLGPAERADDGVRPHRQRGGVHGLALRPRAAGRGIPGAGAARLAGAHRGGTGVWHRAAADPAPPADRRAAQRGKPEHRHRRGDERGHRAPGRAQGGQELRRGRSQRRDLRGRGAALGERAPAGLSRLRRRARRLSDGLGGAAGHRHLAGAGGAARLRRHRAPAGLPLLPPGAQAGAPRFGGARRSRTMPRRPSPRPRTPRSSRSSGSWSPTGTAHWLGAATVGAPDGIRLPPPPSD